MHSKVLIKKIERTQKKKLTIRCQDTGKSDYE